MKTTTKKPLRPICAAEIFLDVWASTGAWLTYQQHLDETVPLPGAGNCK